MSKKSRMRWTAAVGSLTIVVSIAIAWCAYQANAAAEDLQSEQNQLEFVRRRYDHMQQKFDSTDLIAGVWLIQQAQKDVTPGSPQAPDILSPIRTKYDVEHGAIDQPLKEACQAMWESARAKDLSEASSAEKQEYEDFYEAVAATYKTAGGAATRRTTVPTTGRATSGPSTSQPADSRDVLRKAEELVEKYRKEFDNRSADLRHKIGDAHSRARHWQTALLILSVFVSVLSLGTVILAALKERDE